MPLSIRKVSREASSLIALFFSSQFKQDRNLLESVVDILNDCNDVNDGAATTDPSRLLFELMVLGTSPWFTSIHLSSPFHFVYCIFPFHVMPLIDCYCLLMPYQAIPITIFTVTYNLYHPHPLAPFLEVFPRFLKERKCCCWCEEVMSKCPVPHI